MEGQRNVFSFFLSKPTALIISAIYYQINLAKFLLIVCTGRTLWVFFRMTGLGYVLRSNMFADELDYREIKICPNIEKKAFFATFLL